MNIELIHNTLNKIYTDAYEVYQKAKKKYPNASINAYNGHYIRINNAYIYQHYYMPVISNGTLGDICFNLDGISLEFFLNIKEFKNINLEDLKNISYPVEMYNGNNSEEEILFQDMTYEELINKISSMEMIGITINCQTLKQDEVITLFSQVSKIIYPDS